MGRVSQSGSQEENRREDRPLGNSLIDKRLQKEQTVLMSDARTSFFQFYETQWGDRWKNLWGSLQEAGRKIDRLNFFSPEAPVFLAKHPPLPGFPVPSYLPEKNDVLSQNKTLFYRMDAASLFAPLALEIQKEEKILDLCAAPGGKALILAEQSGTPENLTFNEYSRQRKEKLKQVLSHYLPDSFISKIRLTRHDGTRWGLYEKEVYHKILLDAPCSGERHLLEHPEELKKWTPSRTRNLARRQYALLASAYLALKPGGRLVYATCTLSSQENDKVIEALLKKKKKIHPLFREWCLGEKTMYGWQILPDRDQGFGPGYFCILEKEEDAS